MKKSLSSLSRLYLTWLAPKTASSMSDNRTYFRTPTTSDVWRFATTSAILILDNLREGLFAYDRHCVMPMRLWLVKNEDSRMFHPRIRLEDDIDPMYLKQYPEFVVRLQQISCDFTYHCQRNLPGAFSPIALFVHYLFKEEVILALVPCSAWLMDYDYAFNLILSVTLSEMVNGLIKWIFRYPRLCFIDSRIRNIGGAWEEDYGFPSSHTMLMVCVATIHLIHYLTKDQSIVTLIFVPVFFFLVLLTSFTRVYLGLLFLHDVSAAILVAPFVAWAAYALNTWLDGQVLVTRILTGFLLPMSFLLATMVIRENLLPESLIQRRIWGDRAMEGYLKSLGQERDQETGTSDGESPRSFRKSFDDTALRINNHVGATEGQELCILPSLVPSQLRPSTIVASGDLNYIF